MVKMESAWLLKCLSHNQYSFIFVLTCTKVRTLHRTHTNKHTTVTRSHATLLFVTFSQHPPTHVVQRVNLQLRARVFCSTMNRLAHESRQADERLKLEATPACDVAAESLDSEKLAVTLPATQAVGTAKEIATECSVNDAVETTQESSGVVVDEIGDACELEDSVITITNETVRGELAEDSDLATTPRHEPPSSAVSAAAGVHQNAAAAAGDPAMHIRVKFDDALNKNELIEHEIVLQATSTPTSKLRNLDPRKLNLTLDLFTSKNKKRNKSNSVCSPVDDCCSAAAVAAAGGLTAGTPAPSASTSKKSSRKLLMTPKASATPVVVCNSNSASTTTPNKTWLLRLFESQVRGVIFSRCTPLYAPRDASV